MVKNIKLRDVVNKLEGFFFGVIVLNAIVIYLPTENKLKQTFYGRTTN